MNCQNRQLINGNWCVKVGYTTKDAEERKKNDTLGDLFRVLWEIDLTMSKDYEDKIWKQFGKDPEVERQKMEDRFIRNQSKYPSPPAELIVLAALEQYNI